MIDVMRIGGFAGYRARLTEARDYLRAHNLGTIVNTLRHLPNGDVLSTYCYHPDGSEVFA